MKRREFLRTACVVVSAAYLAGCGDSDDPGSLLNPQQPADGFSPRYARLDTELSFGFASDGTRYGFSADQHTLQRFGPSGEVVWTVSGPSTEPGATFTPLALAIDSSERVYLVDSAGQGVQLFSAQGAFLRRLRDGDTVRYPKGVAVRDDRLYVSEAVSARILVYSVDGTYIQSFGRRDSGPGSLNSPGSLAFDHQGLLHVLDEGALEILVFTPEGDFVERYGAASEEGKPGLLHPLSFDIDSAGFTYVADAVHPAVLRISPQTRQVQPFPVTTPEGLGAQPVNLAIDPLTGDLWLTVIEGVLGV